MPAALLFDLDLRTELLPNQIGGDGRQLFSHRADAVRGQRERTSAGRSRHSHRRDDTDDANLLSVGLDFAAHEIAGAKRTRDAVRRDRRAAISLDAVARNHRETRRGGQRANQSFGETVGERPE